MRHFIRRTSSSPDNLSLLLLDNRENHRLLETIQLAKSSGVVLLTLPPRSSNKMHLDVDVLALFRLIFVLHIIHG